MNGQTVDKGLFFSIRYFFSNMTVSPVNKCFPNDGVRNDRGGTSACFPLPAKMTLEHKDFSVLTCLLHLFQSSHFWENKRIFKPLPLYFSQIQLLRFFFFLTNRAKSVCPNYNNFYVGKLLRFSVFYFFFAIKYSVGLGTWW